MFKNVDGRKVELTEAEVAKITAERARMASEKQDRKAGVAAAAAKLEAAVGMTIAEIRLALRG